MSSTERTEINRANSQHSTGQLVVMPTEDLQAYQRHLESFTDEYDPQGAIEAHLVRVLADACWSLNRVAVLEANLLTLASLESQSKALAALSLYSQRLSNQVEKTFTQLRELQKTRAAQEKQQLNNLQRSRTGPRPVPIGTCVEK